MRAVLQRKYIHYGHPQIAGLYCMGKKCPLCGRISGGYQDTYLGTYSEQGVYKEAE